MHGMPVFWGLLWQILTAKYNGLSILLCAKKNNFSYSHLTFKTYGFEITELLANQGLPSTVGRACCLCPTFTYFNMVANFGFAHSHSITWMRATKRCHQKRLLFMPDLLCWHFEFLHSLIRVSPHLHGWQPASTRAPSSRNGQRSPLKFLSFL